MSSLSRLRRVGIARRDGRAGAFARTHERRHRRSWAMACHAAARGDVDRVDSLPRNARAIAWEIA
jgi:hypothetical protein